MKLRNKEKITLLILAKNGEQRGLQIVNNSLGLLRRGTVYLYLKHLVTCGLVERREGCTCSEIGLPWYYYKLTVNGQEAVMTEVEK